MPAMIDLSKRHFSSDANTLGLTVIGTWLIDNDRNRPCLILIRRGEEGNDHTNPCYITVDQAYMWSTEENNPFLARGVREATHFAGVLRLSFDPSTIRQIVLLVENHLGDLLSIPPYHRVKGDVVGVAVIRDQDGNVIKEVEIRDDV